MRRGVDLQSLYAIVYLVVANLIAGVLNLPSVAAALGIARQPGLGDLLAVSYTHLTLPTIYSV